MTGTRVLIGMMAIALLFSSGCAAQKNNTDIEEVLQLNNDILEDPLLKELDSLEASLLIQEDLPQAPTGSATESEPAATVKEQEPTATAPTVSAPAAPAPSASPDPQPSPPPEVTVSATDKRVLFGVIRKVSDYGITLQVIEAKALTAEELKKIKSGEKIPLTLLTEEVLQLRYSTKADFERLDNGSPVPASLSDVVRGQRVRIALSPSGEIKLLRIIRN